LIQEGLEGFAVQIVSVLNASEYGTQVQLLDIIDDDVAQIVLSVNTGAMNESG